MDDAALDALICAEDRQVRQFRLFHATDAERREAYGASARPPQSALRRTESPPRQALSGPAFATLPPDAEEVLVQEYKKSQEFQDSAASFRRANDVLPHGYDGPFLTLTTWGPYTRFEALSNPRPIPPRFENKRTLEERRSKHYPRPLAAVKKETDAPPKPGEALRRWKYDMGIGDDEEL